MSKVVMYTTTYCPYCTAAKALLKGKSIPVEEINVDENEEKRTWLRETTGQMTVPQIFINDQSIGGYQELVALDQSGELDGLLFPK